MPQIKTYCRIKPTASTFEDHDLTENKLFLRVPEVLKDFSSVRQGSRATINHEFNFDYIFKQDATQEEVFDVTALEIVKAFLNGYNGTIFAYGQTGTGKTYTIEGSAKAYKQRGLEPRALSMIYNELENRTEEDISVHVSYLEIYQEIGYDLLNPGLRTQSYVTPFPKVAVLEGYGGLCVVKNLSSHLAASEDVAQSLLLQGQANRKVAATAVHDRSSRSHAVFTIQLTSKKLDSDVIVRSKLHLVDLAGSERVSKTGVLGQQLNEAKCINLSLHYLETVIVALQQDSLAKIRGERTKSSTSSRITSLSNRPRSADGIRDGGRHVPYRNSLLTMLLRDSLGGNCMTSMIATISLELVNLSESISTCRFAGRVACIANTVSRNEELDDKSLIRKLRKKIAELEAEIACLRAGQIESGDNNNNNNYNKNHRMQLTDEDKQICTKVVQQYLNGKITDPVTAGITDPYKFRECLKILKKFISKKGLGLERSESHLSLSVTLPRHSPAPEENDEPDPTSQSVEKTDPGEAKVLKPRKNVNVLKVHNEAVTTETHTPSKQPAPPRDAPPTRSTSAWTDVTSNTTGQPSVNASTNDESVFVSNSKKDPETLSMMLKSGADVKSPFEQKRVKEIKQLNSKVEKMNAELMEKEQKVVEMKIQVAEHELNLMEKHMKTKLGVTVAQVEDQKAYIKQLVSTEADAALIQQERLVEQQLKKRQKKFERQLEYIDFRREQLKKRQENTNDAVQTKASLQDKYGQYRKRDGSLNTRQVFQMLKSEERKQVKAQNHVEREKIIQTSNLMEIKELATRQKLRELKEAVKSGKTQDFQGYDQINSVPNGHMEDTHSETVGKGYHSSSTGKGHHPQDTSKGHHSSDASKWHHSNDEPKRVPKGDHSHNLIVNGWEQPEAKTRPTTKDSGYGRSETFLADNASSNYTRDNKFGSMISVRSGSSQVVPGPDFYAPKKEEKDPTSKWESNYSRPTTPSNLIIPESNETGYTVKVKGGAIVKETENNVTKSAESTGHTSKGENRPHTNKSESKSTVESQKSGINSDLLDSQSKQIEEELLNSKRRQQSERHKKPALFENLPKNTQTYMPSEYVHGMNQGETFDARKMTLNSKNFDTALSSMLQEGDQNVYASYTDYDQFARTKAYKPSPYIQTVEAAQAKKPKPPPKSPPKSRERREREERYNSAEKRLAKGQDGSPLSTKISQYLQQTSSPKRERRHHGRSSSAHAVKGVNISDVSRFRENSASYLLEPTQHSTLEIEEEEHSGKVTALKEKEREENYMSKAQVERDRISRIRKARQSAEMIQRCWRRYMAKKRRNALRK